MARKPRRFDDGGDVREGPHKGIDDDTRARALAFARRNAERGTELMGIGDPEEMAAPKAAAPRSASRTIKPPRDESPAETKRLAEKAGEAEIRRLKAYDKPLERVTPELDIAPTGRLLQGVRGLAQAAARRFAPAELNTIRAAEIPRLPGPPSAPRLSGPENASRLSGSRDTPRLPAPKRTAREREAARDVEDARFADEGNPNYKRGGKVKKYAAGGTVTASRRADGIAQRGKTKGRIY